MTQQKTNDANNNILEAAHVVLFFENVDMNDILRCYNNTTKFIIFTNICFIFAGS